MTLQRLDKRGRMLLVAGAIAVAVAAWACSIERGARVRIVELSSVPVSGEPTPVWAVEEAGWGRPVVAGGSVFFMSQRHDIVAVDAETGVVRWRREIGRAAGPPWGATLAVSDTDVLAGDYDVVAVDQRSGVVRWRFSPMDGYGPGMYLGAVAEGTVYTGSPSGQLFAIDAASGMLRWAVSVGAAKTTVFAPVVDADLVVAGFSTFGAPVRGGVIAVDAGSGKERWRRHCPVPSGDPVSTGWGGGPVATGQRIVGACTTGRIMALARETGAIDWQIASVHDGPPTWTQDSLALTVSGETLVTGSLSGEVSAFDVRTRRARWRFPARELGSVAFALSADEHAAYVPYASGRLVAVDMTTGHERWRTGREQGRFMWPPAADERYVYAASDTSLVALER